MKKFTQQNNEPIPYEEQKGYSNPMEDERHSYWTSRMLGIVGAVLFALFVAVYAYQTLN